ncbi:hypothetical protein ACFWF7_17575 [Nocardia sp. NPDC060256]|uniref:hypothetical protein n=1 Tax=unclassified Nocardia TaxID=2637762 RepID=UPI003649BAD5
MRILTQAFLSFTVKVTVWVPGSSGTDCGAASRADILALLSSRLFASEMVMTLVSFAVRDCPEKVVVLRRSWGSI